MRIRKPLCGQTDDEVELRGPLRFLSKPLNSCVQTVVKTSSLIILCVRRTYIGFEVNCKIKTTIIKRLSAILKCSTLQTGSDTVFKSLCFRPSTRQRSVFESLHFQTRFQKSPFSVKTEDFRKR